MFDGEGVGGAVGGEDAVVVLEVGYVVADLLAKDISEAAAGFFEDDLRGAGIPELGAGAGMDIDVARAVGDEAGF